MTPPPKSSVAKRRGAPSPSEPGGLERWLKGSAIAQAIALAGFAFLLRALHLRFIAGSPLFQAPTADEAENWDLALKLAAGNWLARGVGPFFRPQLFSYFLALLYRLTGGSLPLIHLVLVLLDAGTIGVMYLVARRVWPRRTAVLGAIALAIYWPLLHFSATLNKESFAIHLQAWMLLALILWTRRLLQRESLWGTAVVVGLFAGLGLLCRPSLFLPFLGVLAAMAVLAYRRGAGRGRAILSPAIAAVVAVGLLIPQAVRNFTVGGAPIFYSTHGWLNLYFTNNDEGISWLEYGPGIGWDVLIERPQMEGGVAEDDYVGIDAFWRRKFLAYLSRHPLQFLKGVAVKTFENLNTREVAITNNFREIARLSPVQRWLPGTGVLFPLALVGMVAWLLRPPSRPSRREAGTFLLLFGLLYLAASGVLFTVTRDRLPAMAVLLLFAGPGVKALLDALRGRPRIPRALLLGALVASVVIVHWPLPDEGYTQEEVWKTEQNKGAALTRLWERDHEPQQLSEAIAAYERSLQIRPDDLQAHRMLTRLYWSAGRRDDALAAQERVVAGLRQRYPRNVRTRARELETAGRLALLAAHPERAEAAVREWLSLGVDTLAAMDLQAVALARQGKLSAALAVAEERVRRAPADPDGPRLLQQLRQFRPGPAGASGMENAPFPAPPESSPRRTKG
jgi:4-amino-4-deoxy-L-arabinose transferase-like glycosyltransferase